MFTSRPSGAEARRRHAFTLVEILVVVAIIALLISILLPALSAARRQARTALCVTNLRTIGQAVMFYAQSNQDEMPAGYATAYDNLTKTYKLVVDTDGKTLLSLNAFEFIYPYVQKVGVKKGPTLTNGSNGLYMAIPTYTCPDDVKQHSTNQRPINGQNVEFGLSYGANLSPLFNVLDNYKAGAAKVTKIQNPSTITTFFDNGDDGTEQAFSGGWILSDCASAGQNQCSFEVHHKDGNNFLFADGHVAYHNVSYNKPQYGLPPWPVAWIPGYDVNTWTGPTWVKTSGIGFRSAPHVY